MTPAELRTLLEQVRSHHLPVDTAVRQLQATHPEADLGFAHVDLERRERCGFPEVIFCQGKSNEWVEGVVRQLIDAKQHCLATRVSEGQAAHLAVRFPGAQQDCVARTFWLPATVMEKPIGRVMIITAGTSDLPVAREAL